MKILIVNYAYFINGGPERYLFNIIGSLESYGHEVVPFSMRSKENINTEYGKYFVDAISTDGSWRYNSNYNFKSKLKQIIRIFFSFEVFFKIRRLILLKKPEIAYILHYHKKLSPSVIFALNFYKIPIIVRVSDYLSMCPQAHFFRNNDVCEDCKVTKLNSIKYRCVNKSLSASILWYVADCLHRIINERSKIASYVVTNDFMLQKMNLYGISNFKAVIPTYTENNANRSKNYSYKSLNPFICYVGKISKFKGVDFLLDSYKEYTKEGKKLNLIIVGRDDENIIDSFRRTNPDIKFTYVKHAEKRKVLKIMSCALYTVLPVKWYENLPNVLLESWSVGTPVLSSAIGSMKATITSGKNGYLFKVNNEKDFLNTLDKCLSIKSKQYQLLQQNCLNSIDVEYSEEKHLKKLMQLFQSHIK